MQRCCSIRRSVVPASSTAVTIDEAKDKLLARGRELIHDIQQPVYVESGMSIVNVNVRQRVLRFDCGCALHAHVAQPTAVAKPVLCSRDRDLFTSAK